jgi:hypothetical protein
MSIQIDPSFMELYEHSIPPGRAAGNNPSNELEVNVIFTDHQRTLAALRTAGALAHRLQARINLLVPQGVPYAFPLTSPPVPIQFTERRLLDLVDQGSSQEFLDTSVQIYLCRDWRPCLLQALKPQSLVVIGGRARWWPTKATRLARMLRSAGHKVIFADSSQCL